MKIQTQTKIHFFDRAYTTLLQDIHTWILRESLNIALSNEITKILPIELVKDIHYDVYDTKSIMMEYYTN